MTFLSNIAAVKFEQKKYAECVEFCTKAVDVGRENRADFKVYMRASNKLFICYLVCESAIPGPNLLFEQQEVGMIIPSMHWYTLAL